MNNNPNIILGRIAQWILAHRAALIILIALATAFSAYYYNRIPQDPSVEAMVLEDDPDLAAYNHFKQIFGSDELLLLVVKVPDIFDAQVMADVEALRSKLAEVPYIKDAIAYTNVRIPVGEEDSLIVRKLIPEIPKTPDRMAALKKRAMEETDFIGNLYSRDATTLAIVASMKSLSKEEDTTETRMIITREARKLAATPPFNRYSWKIAGIPVLKSDLVEAQVNERRRFEIISIVMLAVSLFLILRTFVGLAVTIGTVVASVSILMACHYFSGIPLTPVSTILSPLMMIYGISASLHFQTHYILRTVENEQRNDALVNALRVTLVPCFFNSATTAVGFGSNLVSSIRPIREFAMFASIGIMLSFVLSFLLVPSALSFFPPPGKRVQQVNVQGLRMRFLDGIIRFIDKYRTRIIWFNVVVLAVSVYGMSRIKVETRLIEYFRPDSPIRSSYDFIENNLTAISSMEILVDTHEQDGMTDPEVISRMEELVEYMRTREPGLTSVLSLTSLYKRLNKSLHNNDPAWDTIPRTREEAAQLVLLYSMSESESDFYQFASFDYRYGRLSARIKMMSSTELTRLVERIKAKTVAVFSSLKTREISVSVTGTVVLYANMNRALLIGQVKSFGLSLILITIMMLVVAGEVGLGLVSLLPNLMPIAITMGFMGFIGYPLDTTTAMVAPIALGMAVDSTIHFMVRYRNEYLSTRNHHEAMANSVRIIGRAMIGTSMPLAAGFFVLTTSEFLPIFAFGMLSCIVVFLAMIYDLVLTPLCMMLYRPKYKKAGLVDWTE